ncbi:MAG TPA: efflux transporter outer membrane subunit [Tepidisphaeraceae bacterium]|jgi:NodT family efflux transporter outer membrane factor (OMF) lipoprotein
MKRIALGALAACGLSGCTVGPNYTPPTFKPAPAFSEIPPAATTQPSRANAQPIEITEWWATFHDPELTSLIRKAVKSNLNLKQAESRIRSARWSQVIAGSGQYPTANLGAGYLGARGSKNVTFPLSAFGAPSKSAPKKASSSLELGGSGASAGAGGAAAGAGGGGGATGAPLSPLGGGGLPGVETNIYQAGFDASWEIDIFGGIRRTVEASNADYEASIEDRRDVYVSLLAEVARNYVEVRQFQNEIRIAQENLKSQRDSLALTEERFHAGVTTQLDVSRAQAQVASTAASIPSLDAQMHQTIHRLSVLLGEQPSALLEELTRPGVIPSVPDVVPVGVPTDLLRRRPDIRRAERQLASATARVGSATADLYPKLTLVGTFGFDASKFSHVANYASRYWSIGPGISWPIFNAGRIRANIQTYNENQQQALTAYEQTVLQAMQDVEDALVAYSREQMRRQALNESVSANRQSVDLATQQYKQGVADFLTVLEAQRSLYAAQDALAQSDAQIASDLVALYKAMGGGWKVEPSS